jgi:hypothetical protein
MPFFFFPTASSSYERARRGRGKEMRTPIFPSSQYFPPNHRSSARVMTRSVINGEKRCGKTTRETFSFSSTYVSTMLQGVFTRPALRYDIYREYLRERGTRIRTRGRRGMTMNDMTKNTVCTPYAKRAKIARNVAKFRGSFTGDVKRFR